jgi:hypothetical protein
VVSIIERDSWLGLHCNERISTISFDDPDAAFVRRTATVVKVVPGFQPDVVWTYTSGSPSAVGLDGLGNVVALLSLAGAGDRAIPMFVLPDGSMLTARNDEEEYFVIDSAGVAQVPSRWPAQGRFRAGAGWRIATRNIDGDFCIVDLGPEGSTSRLGKLSGLPTSQAFSPDGAAFACFVIDEGSGDTRLFLARQSDSWQPTEILAIEGNRYTRLAWSLDSARLYALLDDQRVLRRFDVGGAGQWESLRVPCDLPFLLGAISPRAFQMLSRS